MVREAFVAQRSHCSAEWNLGLSAMPLTKPRKLVFLHPWLRDLHDPLVRSDDEREAESDAGSGDSTDDASVPASPLHAEPSGWTPLYRRCG